MSVRKFWRRIRGLPAVPHLVIDLGYARFGTGVGTACGDPAIAIIPVQSGMARGKSGEPFPVEWLTAPLPGTVIITFRDEKAARDLEKLCHEAGCMFATPSISTEQGE